MMNIWGVQQSTNYGSKHQKTDFKNHFEKCTFLYQYLIFLISHCTQLPFKNVVGWFFSYVDYFIRNMYRSSVIFFTLVPTQNKLSLCIDIIFYLHIGIHPSRMGYKLFYRHLYHEEACFYLDICLQLFNRPFYNFLV